VLVKPLRQLFMPAILPELSHLRAAGRFKERQVMVRRVSVLTGLVATGLLLVLILIGKPAISLLAGSDYVAAYGVMVALATGGTISAWAVVLEPLLISNGNVHFITVARTCTTVLYLSILYPLTLQFGLMGAGYAAIVQAAIVSLLFLLRVALSR
jgi:O-antigen/teichoic acid export membrane protein